jgi:hypothetical protein
MTSKLVAMTFEEASRWIASQEVRICELEAQLADVLQANQTHCGMLSEAGVRIRELEAAIHACLAAYKAEEPSAYAMLEAALSQGES